MAILNNYNGYNGLFLTEPLPIYGQIFKKLSIRNFLLNLELGICYQLTSKKPVNLFYRFTSKKFFTGKPIFDHFGQ